VEEVTAETAVVEHGEEAGAAVEVFAGVVLGVRIEVVPLVVGEAEAAIEEGGGITNGTVVLEPVLARAAWKSFERSYLLMLKQLKQLMM
jgi:hypothetical protein